MNVLPVISKEGNLRYLVFGKDYEAHKNPNELLDASKDILWVRVLIQGTMKKGFPRWSRPEQMRSALTLPKDLPSGRRLPGIYKKQIW